ncbi:MAG: MBL fold metallo-hydrolase [Thermoplasmatales archaeon]|nr:MBL fold metallo-hydrolase [Thermoplasmatales archaeon]
MKLTIVYDNDVYKKDIGLKSDWGFSCLLTTEQDTVLFDTGAKGNILLSNMEKLGIDPGNISKIVISHEHWDHSGGLEALAPLVGDVELYRLAKKNPSENMRFISVEESREITEGVYTTGRLKGVVDEQSLVLKGEKGWYVLVGCSHPGVKEILNTAKQYGNITGLIGGLHGFNNFSVLKELNFVCPCHCTVHKRKIRESSPETSVDCGVGRLIKI